MRQGADSATMRGLRAGLREGGELVQGFGARLVEVGDGKPIHDVVAGIPGERIAASGLGLGVPDEGDVPNALGAEARDDVAERL